MLRVELFPALWTVYRHKLSPPGQTFWLASVRTESDKRVSESKRAPGRQDQQHLGPVVWWNSELRQTAMYGWFDEVVDEMRVEDMELNDDAEWVLSGKGPDKGLAASLAKFKQGKYNPSKRLSVSKWSG